MFREIEKNLPFVTSILLGLLVEAVNFLYVDQLLLHIAVLVVIFMAFTGFDGWAILGAVLVALTFEAWRGGDPATTRILIGLLGVGTFFNYLAYLFQAYRINERLPKPLIIQNVTVALAGFGSAMFLQFRACEFAIANQFDNPILQARFGLAQCRLGELEEVILTDFTQYNSDDLQLYIALATLCAQAFIVSPMFWGLVGAALSASWFRVWMVGKILLRLFTGFWGAALLSFITLVWLMVSAALEATIIPPTHPYWEPMFLVLLAVDLLIFALGVGWGASWVSD